MGFNLYQAMQFELYTLVEIEKLLIQYIKKYFFNVYLNQ